MASSALAGIWRSVGGSMPSSMLQCRSYSDAGLNGHAPPISQASSSADPVVYTPLSREFLAAVPTIEAFGSDRPVFERIAYQGKMYEGYRVYRTVNSVLREVGPLPIPTLKPQLTRTGMNEEESPVGNGMRASRNVVQESRHEDSPRHGVVCDEALPNGAAYGRGEVHPPSSGTTSEVVAILKRRQRQGLSIDSKMVIEILKRCSKQKDVTAATHVHDCIILSGMDKHPRVANALMNVYFKCGRLQDARRVFDGLEKAHRNVITWTAMIGEYAKSGHGVEAYRLFLQMKQEGFTPNAITYISVLNACANPGALKWVKEVHSHALEAGLESDLRVGCALVRMYAKNGSISDARVVFDRIEKRDAVTWTVMIGAYAESGCGMEAYQLFLQMKREGFIPDPITFLSILNASASRGALEWVKEIHSHARNAGLESDLRVGSALVRMYAKSGSIDDARRVFDRMKMRNVITWNIMIGAYAESGCGMEAYRLFLQMKRKGFMPDAITFLSILNASASPGALEWVKEVHGHAWEAGLESDSRVANALVHMYAKSGSIDEARLVFDRMEKRTVITWNTIIGAYAERGCSVEAYRLFVQMKRKGFTPNGVTYMNILSPTANGGALEWVEEVHGDARKAGLELDLRVGSALVHMYAKSGSIDDARLIFEKMEKRNAVTWNTMIGGLALHGCGEEALKLFKEMIADCVKPDETSFAAVLSACSHAGLVDDGYRIFSAVMRDYGIEPTVVHYTCMVDMLGRAGRLEEAKLLIDNMPLEPDAVIWRALLGACRTFSNEELGEFAAKEVLKLEPRDPAAYVLLSNIYAATGKWEKVSSVRTLMHERGVRKEPGRSWIEVDNRIHEFLVGDTSHPEVNAIYSELKKLNEQLKSIGYIPDTKLVLQNIDEEDKELALCSHSEKLAIVYGLLRVPRGKPIRVQKNLRVCSDCHATTKLISEATGREIRLRDANRFHRFKDGVCSCGDYW